MGQRILLAEDEALLREATSEDLAELGYEVVCAADGVEAFTVLEQGTAFDVLITDIRMPGGCDGWELARKARDLRPGLRVIYISGYSPDQQPVADATFLKKPFRLADLARALSPRD